MTDDDFTLVIVSVAMKHHQPVDKVLSDMQEALNDMYTTPFPTPEMQLVKSRLKKEGDIPTVREYIEFLQEELGGPYS